MIIINYSTKVTPSLTTILIARIVFVLAQPSPILMAAWREGGDVIRAEWAVHR